VQAPQQRARSHYPYSFDEKGAVIIVVVVIVVVLVVLVVLVVNISGSRDS
jgi:hypothetical protein